MVTPNPVKLTVNMNCHTDEHIFCKQCDDCSHKSVPPLRKLGCPRSLLMPLSQQNSSTKTVQGIFSRQAPDRLTISEVPHVRVRSVELFLLGGDG